MLSCTRLLLPLLALLVAANSTKTLFDDVIVDHIDVTDDDGIAFDAVEVSNTFEGHHLSPTSHIPTNSTDELKAKDHASSSPAFASLTGALVILGFVF